MVGVQILLFKNVLRMICKNREYLNSFASTFEHAYFSSSFWCALIDPNYGETSLSFFRYEDRDKKEQQQQQN